MNNVFIIDVKLGLVRPLLHLAFKNKLQFLF